MSWKLSFRQDQVETMLECFDYLSGKFENDNVSNDLSLLARRIARDRVDEIRQYIRGTVG